MMPNLAMMRGHPMSAKAPTAARLIFTRSLSLGLKVLRSKWWMILMQPRTGGRNGSSRIRTLLYWFVSSHWPLSNEEPASLSFHVSTTPCDSQ